MPRLTILLSAIWNMHISPFLIFLKIIAQARLIVNFYDKIFLSNIVIFFHRPGQCPVITRDCYVVPLPTSPPDTMLPYSNFSLSLRWSVSILTDAGDVDCHTSGALRSESKITMIAGGNHTTIQSHWFAMTPKLFVEAIGEHLCYP